jgi:hypothetical protein
MMRIEKDRKALAGEAVARQRCSHRVWSKRSLKFWKSDRPDLCGKGSHKRSKNLGCALRGRRQSLAKVLIGELVFLTCSMPNSRKSLIFSLDLRKSLIFKHDLV